MSYNLEDKYELIETIKQEYENVPFGNSVYQILTQVISHETDSRNYRQCLLQFNEKYNILQKNIFKYKKSEIDVEEIQYELDNFEEDNNFKFRKKQLELEEKKWELTQNQNLIKDCVIELETYAKVLQKLPKYSRAEFEKSEKEFLGKKAKKLIEAKTRAQAFGVPSITGELMMLENMGVDLENLQIELKDGKFSTNIDDVIKDSKLIQEIHNDFLLTDGK